MSIPAKVLWGEGLFLRPQHFQQQDRYHEARLNQTASALHPYSWGVRRLVVDHDALRSDVLRLDELSVIFPDGEVYSAPQGDPLPLQVRLSALPPDVQSVTYHAALPSLKPHGDNCATAGTARADARYEELERDTQDLFTNAADAPVSYLKKALRLVADIEPLESYESFPLLRLQRVPTGGWEPDPTFTPPSMTIDGAPGLHTRL
ncbi:MAG TPA: type VI secretion system baseplate subunit TssK, partial [Telluria sp.]|nr:type VI secretion system baseplate subunit TssK [Telluria sp.]